MSEEPQIISELRPGDLEQLADRRSLIEAYLTDDMARESYRTVSGKLGLLRNLLTANAFSHTQRYELQSMGVVLGDALAQALGFRWMIVDDEYGRDPVLALAASSIMLFPLTMISKRVEAGDAVDVFELFKWAAVQARDLR